jgi:hypothetical protein
VRVGRADEWNRTAEEVAVDANLTGHTRLLLTRESVRRRAVRRSPFSRGPGSAGSRLARARQTTGPSTARAGIPRGATLARARRSGAPCAPGRAGTRCTAWRSDTGGSRSGRTRVRAHRRPAVTLAAAVEELQEKKRRPGTSANQTQAAPSTHRSDS